MAVGLKLNFSVEEIVNGFLVTDVATGRQRHAAHQWSIGTEVERFLHERTAALEAKTAAEPSEASAPMQQGEA